MSHTRRAIGRALLSVSDKAGLVDLGRALHARGVALVSTGGTARTRAEAGLPVRDVADVTGFPEMMDGRIKTLHPKVHGGLLAVRENPEHQAAMLAHGVEEIDLLVVNLYPFEATLAKGASFDDCIENIDIGGPAMIRAAAKNHQDVTVVVDPQDYGDLLAELDANDGATSLAFRRRLAARAFARTAAYDAAIGEWFAGVTGDATPRRRSLGGALALPLRYGENPHQQAGLYLAGPPRPGAATAKLLQGKELSYNNIADTDAAYECVAEFGTEQAACVIVKHANPCGVALGGTLVEAYRRALRCDPVSAFGGIVAVNRPLDRAAAEAITAIFTEVVIAPGADAEARAVFAGKKNLRLLIADGLPDPRAPGVTLRTVAGGFLAQTRDAAAVADMALRVVTKRPPDEREFADLRFAFAVCKHVKSNAIIYAKPGQTVGIGAGQMSRVDSVKLAAMKAQMPVKGCVMASDAFFPFRDGLDAAAEVGITAVIQPGGSIRDAEVVKAADEHGMAMILTGMRHFRH